MSWLRLDDGFAEHYKIAELTDREFRVWVRILCYTARADRAELTAATRRQIVGLTPAMTSRFVTIGLLEDAGSDTYAVHDWILYSDRPVIEKVAYYFGRKPEASANEVYRAIGGKRELVLGVVRDWQESGSRNGSQEPAIRGSGEPLLGGTREP